MILEESLKNLHVGIRGGGILVSHRPLFTRDSKNLLVVSGDTVRIYSAEGGDFVGFIQTPTSASIANIILSSSSSSRSSGSFYPEEVVIILTEAGELLRASLETYDFISAENVNLSVPREWTSIRRWLHLAELGPGKFLFVGHPENSEEVMVYQATTDLESSKGRYNLEKVCWRILPTSHAVAVGCSGNLVAAIQSDAVFMTNLGSKVSRWHKSGTREFTSVAAHPHEWIVATGDDSGRILLWKNFLEEKSPAKAVFHWHSLPVADLCFTTDGTKLLSGGSECCLVRWDTGDSSDRKILPRMGLPIRHIAISNGNTLAAVSHADNCIQLVDASNKIVRVIQNITQCYIPENKEDEWTGSGSLGGDSVFQAGLHVDPNSKSLVMNGKPGHLQCYSLREDKHLYTMDITQQNFVAAERRRPIPNADVTHIAFSSHGRWLATVESLIEGFKYFELRLKFWKFDVKKQVFLLNTSINWPHENGIRNLRIQPRDDKEISLVAATSGHDRTFKTWGIVHDTSIHGKSEWWNCENVGSYRNQSAGPLAFSQDGSVLAVPFSHTLTLWKTESHELTGTLYHSKLKEDIRLVEFSSHPTSHLLICTTKNNLIVWDVITLSLMWTVPLEAESLAVDGLSNLVAVFSVKRHLYLFKPEHPEPLAIHKNVSRSRVVSSIFVSNTSPHELKGLKSMLLFINSSQELCAMLSRDSDESGVGSRSLKIQKGISTLTPFAKLIAENTVSSVRGPRHLLQGTTVVGIPGSQVIREIMDISPQSLPSISYYCNQFLSAISVQVNERDKMESLVESLEKTKKSQLLDSLDEHSSSSSESESESEGEGHSHFFGTGMKAILQNRRKGLLQKKADDTRPAPVATTKAKGTELDLDLIATEDISWIRATISND